MSLPASFLPPKGNLSILVSFHGYSEESSASRTVFESRRTSAGKAHTGFVTGDRHMDIRWTPDIHFYHPAPAYLTDPYPRQHHLESSSSFVSFHVFQSSSIWGNGWTGRRRSLTTETQLQIFIFLSHLFRVQHSFQWCVDLVSGI